MVACGERASSLLSRRDSFFVNRSHLAMPIALVALASLLAACSSGTTGMLPANPQTHNQSPSSNRGMGSAISSGSGAVATATASTTRSNARPSSPIASGTQGGATPQFSENGPPSTPPWPTGGGFGGGGGGGGGGCGPGNGLIATPVNPLDRVAPNPCGGGGGGGSTPCYPNGQGGTPCVATDPGTAPSQGQCDSSPANDEVGTDNLGTGTTWGTTIANVYGFANANNTVVYGWAYQTENQNMFFQTNADSGGVGILLGFLQNIPGLSNIANAIISSTTGPYQLNGQQWQNVQQSMKSSSFKLHKCWAKNYNGGGGTSG